MEQHRKEYEEALEAAYSVLNKFDEELTRWRMGQDEARGKAPTCLLCAANNGIYNLSELKPKVIEEAN